MFLLSVEEEAVEDAGDALMFYHGGHERRLHPTGAPPESMSCDMYMEDSISAGLTSSTGVLQQGRSECSASVVRYC